MRTSQTTAALRRDAAEAVAAAHGPPGQVATLILPADVSWARRRRARRAARTAGTRRATERPSEVAATAATGAADRAPARRQALREPGCGPPPASRRPAARRSSPRCFPPALQRGAGLPSVERLAYFAEPTQPFSSPASNTWSWSTRKPRCRSSPTRARGATWCPTAARCTTRRGPSGDVPVEPRRAGRQARRRRRDAAAAAALPAAADRRASSPRTKVCQAIGAVLPEGAIISDEAQTSGLTLASHTAGAPRHDVLTLTGGAIGQGLPVAVGAAVACPDRPVLALEGDGSAMYTIQSLWTMAREQLDITVVIFNNRSYAILNIELERVGARAAGPGEIALDLANPNLDFVAIADGMGVPSVRAGTGEELIAALERALAEPGPHLIEAVVPSVQSLEADGHAASASPNR